MNKDREPANTNSQLDVDVFGKNYDEQVRILKDRIKEWWKTNQTNFDYKTNGIYRIFNNIDIKSYRFFIENDSLYAYMYNFVITDPNDEKEMIFDNSKLLIFKFNEEDKHYNKILNGLNALLNTTTGGKRKNKKTKKQKNKKTKKQKNKKTKKRL